MVHYQVLLCLDLYYTDDIATNTLCKLNFRFLFHVLTYKSAAGLSGLL